MENEGHGCTMTSGEWWKMKGTRNGVNYIWENHCNGGERRHSEEGWIMRYRWEEEEVFIHTTRAMVLKQHKSKTCQKIFTNMSLTFFWKIRRENKNWWVCYGNQSIRIFELNKNVKRWYKRKGWQGIFTINFQIISQNLEKKISVNITINKFRT